MFFGSLFADTMYPTFYGTGVRDYSKPSYKSDSNNVYHPTIQNTNVRDYGSRSPSYQREGNVLNPTIQGTNVRDYSSPSYVIEED